MKAGSWRGWKGRISRGFHHKRRPGRQPCTFFKKTSHSPPTPISTMSDVHTQTAPGYVFPSRVLSIPLVAHSIDSLHSTLSSSPYTQRIYSTSTSLAHSAYDTAARVSAPVYSHPRAQAYLTLADDYAVKGLNAVEAKIPYPFQSTPETVYNDLKRAPEQAKEVATKTIDEKIKAPAYNLAATADQVSIPFQYTYHNRMPANASTVCVSVTRTAR